MEAGIVVTKYDHVEHPIPGVTCYEAGHPVPDENTFRATQAVLDMTADLDKSDTVHSLLMFSAPMPVTAKNLLTLQAVKPLSIW